MKETSNSNVLTGLNTKEPQEFLKQNFKSNNNNTLNLKQIEGIEKLSVEGTEQIQNNENKAILLIGYSYGGKTTLGHLLSNKPLKSVMDEETGVIILEAMDDNNELPLIRGSYNLFLQSNTVPNKFVDNSSGIVIWDCPSFNDTYLHPERASFDYKKLCLQHEQVKIVFVHSLDLIKEQRGSIFVSALKQFSDNFQNIEIDQVKDSIFLVVTGTNPGRHTLHVKKIMFAILEGYNEFLKPKEKQLLEHFSNSDNIFVFPTPTEVEENFKSSLSLSDIDSGGHYLNFNELEVLGDIN